MPLLISVALGALALAEPPKRVTVTADDTVIAESCVVVIPPGTVIADRNGDGVIRITASNITVDFAGAILTGSPAGVTPDNFQGCGVRVENGKNVTLKNLNVHGFKVGVRASNADGLVIENADLSRNFQQRLSSTPAAEDPSDWLWPHNNDQHEWVTTYGAGLCVESSSKVSISDVRVNHGQNGIILDRVNDSKVFDNDCSFNSGWGLAMWRSSRNTLSRNALDFCIRGYSHGVYSRGQDSAGILFFEQCCDNTLVENSATHCGDGIFGFAGREAIGESEPPAGFDPAGTGCNNNLLIDNDFSYSAAHGIEMTFCYRNRFLRNRLIGNGFTGIWAGYCQDTTVAFNTIDDNGGAGHGLERGGVCIEHGSGNVVVQNIFKDNPAAVQFWWDDDRALLDRAPIKAKYRAVTSNIVANNSFDGDAVALTLRDAGQGHVKDNVFASNTMVRVAKDLDATRGSEPRTTADVDRLPVPRAVPLGKRRVVGARSALAGRESMIVTEWGPYDHAEPLVRPIASAPGSRTLEIHRAPSDLQFDLHGAGVRGSFKRPARPGLPATYTITATLPGIVPYTLDASTKSWKHVDHGAILNVAWDVRFFAWTENTDPRKGVDAWRALAEPVTPVQVSAIDFAFGQGGPGDLKRPDSTPPGASAKLPAALTNSAVGANQFGLVATAQARIPKGIWRVNTLSDDGVRVRVNGKTVLENWTWHGPTRDTGTFTMDADGTAEFVVEYFDLDGYAVLKLGVEPGS